MIIAPMAAKGEEPVASMGNDAALAVLSDRQPPLFAYFKQLFAQVTNPPIDPIRENVVMSLQTGVGAEVNLLAESPEQAHQLVMDQPILRNHELEKLRQVSHEIFDAATLDITWPIEDGPDGMERGLEALCEEAERYVEHGANILILSDRNLGPERVAMPSLLAVAAVHHHLVRARHAAAHRAGDRVRRAARHPPHGDADRLRRVGDQPVPDVRVARRAGRPLAAARGPRARGGREADRQGDRQGPAEDDLQDGDLDDPVLLRRADLRGRRARARADRQATSPARRRGSAASACDVLATEALERHFRAYPRTDRDLLPVGGVLQWRRDGELPHLEPGHDRQPPARRPRGRRPEPRAPTATATATATAPWLATRSRPTTSSPARPTRRRPARAALRGLMKLRYADEPVPLDEVEPATEIVKRFSTGAMSLGSLSREAHETLAIAMNRLGGKSNTGEGGEDPSRYIARRERRPAPLGDQAGRLGPLRGHDQLPGQRRPAPDQDGPGRQARRGRPAARPQGRRLHRQDPQLDARRRPDLARRRTTTSTRSRTSSS